MRNTQNFPKVKYISIPLSLSVFFTWILCEIPQCLGQDNELTNYKSGINLQFGNSESTATDKGVTYAEEYFYYDKIASDKKVVYIKDTTAISMSHNSRNIAGDDGGGDNYESVGTGVGAIKFKPDGDQRWSIYPAKWMAYSAPFDFKGLNYGIFGASETAVVGATGGVGTLSTANKTTYYFRGMRDSVGDEWHTLTVADDDSVYAAAGDAEYDSSDGKVFLFVVNPKTPCATWRVSGSGEFYTTPPKKYFIPVIYDQTTYFTGTVTCELRDINGNNVFYRINGGTFKDAGAKSVILNQDNFNTGSNTLEYYYAGNAAYTKTRIVVKNPDFPSAGETHGDRLWVNSSYWQSDVVPRFNGSKAGNFGNWLSNWGSLAHTGVPGGSPSRTRGGGGEDALIARYYGMTRTRSGETIPNSRWAKSNMMQTFALIDPVGAELNHSNQPIPSREIFYRGYTDVNAMFSALIAYDVIAGHFRTNQGYEYGLSPVQDYWIRDAFAGWLHTCSLFIAGYNDPAYGDFDSGGMWETSRNVSAALVTVMMPNYSTKYYGTSGMNGNASTYPWCPFRDDQYTWKDIFLENSAKLSPPGMPNVHKKVGVEDYMVNSEGNYTDRPGYTSTTNMGHIHVIWWGIQKLFNPSHDFTRANLFLNRAATGQLYGLKKVSDSDALPVSYYYAGALNAWFPEFRNVAKPKMLALPSTDTNSWSKQTQQGGPLFMLWYDHDLPAGSAPATKVEIPSFTPPEGTYTQTQNVTITSATPGATIRYTMDGTAPTKTTGMVYAGPINIDATATLKAIAYNGTNDDSLLKSGTYSLTLGGTIQTPVISPAGGSYLRDQQISITSQTPGVTIFYTNDGSNPTSQSTTYTGPFTIKSNMAIRAIGVKTGYQTSAVKTEIYQFGSVSSTNSIWGGDAIAPPNQTFAISFMVTPATNSLIGLSSGKTVNVADLAAIVRFAPDGFVDARNGGVYQANTVLPYTPGNPYKVLMSVDMSTRRYSVTVTPVGANSVIIATNYAFRTEQAAVTSLGYLAVWSQQNLATVSNLNLGVRPSPPTGLKVLTPEGGGGQ